MLFQDKWPEVLPTLVLHLTLLVGSPVQAGTEQAWELRKDADGIQIYSRPVEGWTIHEIKGEVHLAAPVDRIAAVIEDIPHQGKLSDVVASAKVTRRDSETQYQYHSVIKMPWPLRNRDIVSDRRINSDSTSLEMTIGDTAVPEALPRQDGLVRIERSRTTWTLTPRDGGVDVQMRVLSDPNGPIPSSVINTMSVGTPFKTLENLRRLAVKEQRLGGERETSDRPPKRPE